MSNNPFGAAYQSDDDVIRYRHIGIGGIPIRSNRNEAQLSDAFTVDPFGQSSTAATSSSLPTNDDVTIIRPKTSDPVADVCLSLTNLISETLITHPCTVLRRQCQVHQYAKSFHLTPFTLIPVVYKVISYEGVLTLWKGAIGSGVLWGLSTAAEILIGDIFGLPRTYVKHGNFEKYCRHVALKACTAVATTPFIVASFIETVRSESGLGGEEIRVMDVITNGINRLRFDFTGPKDNSKRFSLLYLSVPTAFFYTSHYVIATYFYDWIYALLRRYVDKKPAYERTLFHRYLPQIFATLTSHLVADLACYPLETILHRLYIQGTRTLIDNLDSGITAVSITAKYGGFLDCLKSLINREGFWALYSGIGALGLQYILHLCLLRFVRTCFQYGTNALEGKRQANSGMTSRISSTSLQFEQPRASEPSTQKSFENTENPFAPSTSRFTPYPTFGQTADAFGSAASPLLTAPTANFFGDRPSTFFASSSGDH